MKKARIITKEYDVSLAKQLTEKLHVSLLVAKLLLTRNIKNIEKAEQFLRPSKEQLYSPLLLKDMDKAVDIISEAIAKKKNICIYGDYDVDGITSTSLLYLFLKEIGANIRYYLPHRIHEGYGLNESAVRKIAEQGIDLLITVDTGISAVKEVALAKELGLTIVITDHHECQPILPQADAVIDPKREDDAYPFKEIAGVGVAFKLICAITEEIKKTNQDISVDPFRWIELVAIGTVSDLMPLVEENRIFVKEALQKMASTDIKGLKALLEVSGVEADKVSSGMIGFRIGPRLNAAGRMGSAERGVELFLSQDDSSAKKLAEELDEENKKRQETENAILEEALLQIENREKLDDILVIAGEGWHHGVIGIVASRILEKYYRPVIVLAVEEEKAVGSARSVSGFNLFEALCSCKDLFLKFGGHEMAAGMTLEKGRIEEFRERINAYAKEHITEEILTPREVVDFEMNVSDIDIPLIEELQLLSPYGIGNPEPKFLVESHLSEIRQMGKENQHLRLGLADKMSYMDGVAFFEGEQVEKLYSDFSIKATGSMQINEWNGIRKPQMMLSYFTQTESIFAFFQEHYRDFQEDKKRVKPNLTISREDCKVIYIRLKQLQQEEKAEIEWQELPIRFGKKKREELSKIVLGIAIFVELGICKLKQSKQGLRIELVDGVRAELDKSQIYTRYKG